MASFLFEFGYPLLALGQGTRRIRDSINLGPKRRSPPALIV